MNELWKPKRINLEMNDRKGVEYADGDIVTLTDRKSREIFGYIRYSCGRFEVVCPFKDQRFIFGLNPEYEIVSNMLSHPQLIHNQIENNY